MWNVINWGNFQCSWNMFQRHFSASTWDCLRLGIHCEEKTKWLCKRVMIKALTRKPHQFHANACHMCSLFLPAVLQAQMVDETSAFYRWNIWLLVKHYKHYTTNTRPSIKHSPRNHGLDLFMLVSSYMQVSVTRGWEHHVEYYYGFHASWKSKLSSSSS